MTTDPTLTKVKVFDCDCGARTYRGLTDARADCPGCGKCLLAFSLDDLTAIVSRERHRQGIPREQTYHDP